MLRLTWRRIVAMSIIAWRWLEVLLVYQMSAPQRKMIDHVVP